MKEKNYKYIKIPSTRENNRYSTQDVLFSFRISRELKIEYNVLVAKAKKLKLILPTNKDIGNIWLKAYLKKLKDEIEDYEVNTSEKESSKTQNSAPVPMKSGDKEMLLNLKESLSSIVDSRNIVNSTEEQYNLK